MLSEWNGLKTSQGLRARHLVRNNYKICHSFISSFYKLEEGKQVFEIVFGGIIANSAQFIKIGQLIKKL
jgi:hypothetical protein